jgi:hypothetical protein
MAGPRTEKDKIAELLRKLRQVRGATKARPVLNHADHALVIKILTEKLEDGQIDS